MLIQNDQDYFTNRANRLNSLQASQFIRHTVKTLAQWRYWGIGSHFIKMARKIHYNRRDLEDWLKSRIQDLGSDE